MTTKHTEESLTFEEILQLDKRVMAHLIISQHAEIQAREEKFKALAGIDDVEGFMKEVKSLIETAADYTWDKPSKGNVEEACQMLGEALALFPKPTTEEPKHCQRCNDPAKTNLSFSGWVGFEICAECDKEVAG